MTEISDSLRLLFETTVEEEGDRYVVSIPDELVDGGTITPDTLYRVALLGSAAETGESQETTETERARPAETPSSQPQGPPVEEGETREVAIDTLGDQGDGIAKVERGFIVIVPGTKPGDRVEVEITDVKETVAFAETVGEATVR